MQDTKHNQDDETFWFNLVKSCKDNKICI